MYYQRLHLLAGFILDLRGQLNASAKSSKFDRLPMTLSKEQGMIYELIELLGGTIEISLHRIYISVEIPRINKPHLSWDKFSCLIKLTETKNIAKSEIY